MVSTLQYARKVGGSLMVSIPKEIIVLEKIAPGEIVEIDVRKVKKNWFGALKKLKPLKKEEKLDIHD